MSVTISELDQAVNKIETLRNEKQSAAHKLSEIQAQLDQAESEALELLKKADLPNFRGKNGLISISHRTSVRVPKEPGEREAFFNYLKGRQLFDSMITVNSQTLNAFYKQELEIAKTQGNTEFALPGITGETIAEIISFRKN